MFKISLGASRMLEVGLAPNEKIGKYMGHDQKLVLATETIW